MYNERYSTLNKCIGYCEKVNVSFSINWNEYLIVNFVNN